MISRTALGEIQPPSRAQVNAQLGDAIAHRLNISHQTELKAFDPGGEDTAYRLILQLVDPGGKFGQWPDREHTPSVIERLHNFKGLRTTLPDSSQEPRTGLLAF